MCKLTVNVGGMFSGKSTELLRQGKRHVLAGHDVVYMKPSMDDRYSKDHIVTHEGAKIPAINITDSLISLDVLMADVVLIDEVQFIGNRLIEDVIFLLLAGKIIYASGLDMDFQGVPFMNTVLLMGLADDVNKLHAVCSMCGNDAVMSARISDSKDTIELGSDDKYIPMCRSCYFEFMKERAENNGV